MSHKDPGARAGVTYANTRQTYILGTILLRTLNITTPLLAVGFSSEWIPVEEQC